MPRVRLQDVQDDHDEVTNDGRRPQKIRKANTWDDRSRNPAKKNPPPRVREMSGR